MFMDIKQVATLMNGVTTEIIGEGTVVNEDLSNVVDIGKAIFDNTSYDHFVKTLVDHIGRVMFVDRKYNGNTLSLYRDAWEYGAVMEKVYGLKLPEATEPSLRAVGLVIGIGRRDRNAIVAVGKSVVSVECDVDGDVLCVAVDCNVNVRLDRLFDGLSVNINAVCDGEIKRCVALAENGHDLVHCLLPILIRIGRRPDRVVPLVDIALVGQEHISEKVIGHVETADLHHDLRFLFGRLDRGVSAGDEGGGKDHGKKQDRDRSRQNRTRFDFFVIHSKNPLKDLFISQIITNDCYPYMNIR